MEHVGHQTLSQSDRRLILPAYHVNDAARYAGTTPATIVSWQREQGQAGPALGVRDSGVALSFLQLVELRFVAAMRDLGMKLKDIRAAREYLQSQFKTEFPFADIRLKSDGQSILVDLEETEGAEFRGKVLVANKWGQYAWKEIIGERFHEFQYGDRFARRWHVAGKSSPILIDPLIAYGSPQIRGVPTWVVKNRHDGGESSDEIAKDFMLTKRQVKAALNFEQSADKNKSKQTVWTH